MKDVRFSVDSSRSLHYKLGINKFTDMTHEELMATKTGYKMDQNSSNLISSSNFRYADAGEVPPQVDWRERGAVTDAKNQHRCGN